MARIKKLSIKGLRSFSPHDEQTITFSTPLTLILGNNGTGKTTLLESLKFSLTGDQPPNSRGGTFVSDPVLNQDMAQITATVKLEFINGNNERMLIQRSLEMKTTTKSKTVRTKNVSIRRFKDKNVDKTNEIYEESDEKSEEEAFSQSKTFSQNKKVKKTKNTNENSYEEFEGRIADINNDIAMELNMKQGLIDNVLFVHQTEQLWPFGDQTVIKKKMDNIFDSSSKTKFIENLKTHRKNCTHDLNLLKLRTENSYKQKLNAVKLSTEIAELEAETKIKNEQLKTEENAIEELETEIKSKNEVYKLIREKNIKFSDLKNEFREFQYFFEETNFSTENPKEIHGFSEFFDVDLKKLTEQNNFDKVKSLITAKIDEDKNFIEEVEFRILENESLLKKSQMNQIKRQQLSESLTEKIKTINENRFNLRIEEQTEIDSEILGFYMESFKKTLKGFFATNFSTIKFKELSEKTLNLIENIKRKKENRKEIETLKLQTEQLKTRFSNEENKKNFEENQRKLEVLSEKIKEKREFLEIKTETASSEKYKKNLYLLEKFNIKDSFNKEKLKRNVKILTIFEVLKLTIQENSKKFQQNLEKLILVLKKPSLRNFLTEQLSTSNNFNKKDVLTENFNKKDVLREFFTELKKMDNIPEKLKSADLHRQIYSKIFSSIEEKGFCIICDNKITDTEKINKKRKNVDEKLTLKKQEILNSVTVNKFGLENIELKEDDLGILEEIENNLTDSKKKVFEAANILKKLSEDVRTGNFGFVDKIESFDEFLTNKTLKIDNLSKTVLNSIEESNKTSNNYEIFNFNFTGLNDRNFIAEVQNLKESSRNSETASVQNISIILKNYSSLISFDTNFEKIQLYEINSELKKYEIQHLKLLNKLKTNSNDSESNLKMKIEFYNEKTADLLEKNEKFEKTISESFESLKSEIENIKVNEEIKKIKETLHNIKIQRDPINDLISFREDFSNFQSKLVSDWSELIRKRKELSNLFEEFQKMSDGNKKDEGKKGSESSINYEEFETKKENLKKLENILRYFEKLKKHLKFKDKLRGLEAFKEKTFKEFENLASEIKSVDFNAEDVKISFISLKNSLTKIENYLADNLGGLNKVLHNLNSNLNEKRTIKYTLKGSLTELIKSKESKIREYEKEYKNADKNYKELFKKFKLTELYIKDIGNCVKVSEMALKNYHREKIDEINSILKRLFRNVCNTSDIEFFQLELDNEKDYSYKMVMYKTVKEKLIPINMKGRCSSGQSVICSILLRLALAEAFVEGGAIIALDEPTTNLDNETIENLALMLKELFEECSNHQFVIITHDERFIELINNGTGFYKLAKRGGYSKIAKML